MRHRQLNGFGNMTDKQKRARNVRNKIKKASRRNNRRR
jgi:hypothetical protein